MKGFLNILAVASVMSALVLPVGGCGGDTGSGGDDSGNFLVPDYEGQMQKARDTANSAEEQQKAVEDNIRQMEQGP